MSKFSVTEKEPRMVVLMAECDHKTVAQWAIACTERVLPFFEEAYPADLRPRNALDTLQAWLDTGRFSMVEIRTASLAAHAAAREIGEDNPARSAARAAGQAVATAHVATHSLGAANYGVQAVYRAADSAAAAAQVTRERDWQYQRLLQLREAQSAASGKDHNLTE